MANPAEAPMGPAGAKDEPAAQSLLRKPQQARSRRTLERMIAASAVYRHAVVIGGGLLNLLLPSKDLEIRRRAP
jgi:hypothetical protein